MFISSAFAQASESAMQSSPVMGTLLQFALIIGVFYVLIIRPQKIKADYHAKMISELVKGDTIVTAGGIVAKVSQIIDAEYLMVDIGEGVKVKIMRSTIKDCLDEKGFSKLSAVDEKSKPNKPANDSSKKEAKASEKNQTIKENTNNKEERSSDALKDALLKD